MILLHRSEGLEAVKAWWGSARVTFTFQRHMAFIMGFPELALQMWNKSTKKQSYKHKKIVPVSELDEV